MIFSFYIIAGIALLLGNLYYNKAVYAWLFKKSENILGSGSLSKLQLEATMELNLVDENSRGCRISEQMINMANDYAQKLGYGKMYVTSGEHGLYEKYGFVYIGDYQTIYGTSDQLFERELN